MSQSPFRTALVTGGSAGIGAEFARQLAAAGTSLILVARRKEKLAAFVSELKQHHSTTVEILAADLSNADDVERVEGRIAECKTLDLLINNAGFGGLGLFWKDKASAHLAMIQVHVTASVRLARAALAGMVSRSRGSIINVASLAAFSPLSGPMYSGTKAFLVAFSLGLQHELTGTRIRVQALCPGFTHTEFHEGMDLDRPRIPGFLWMSANDVVRISLKALSGRRVVCIPGWKNRLIAAALRCPPSAALITAMARLYLRKKQAAQGG